MIKKSIYIIMVLITIIGCKKNEESFSINEDLLSPILSHAIPEIPDYHSSWNGDYLLVRTSNEIVATGEKINTTEHKTSIKDKEIFFAKKNLRHNFSNPSEIVDWVSINNDEIKIESDAFFFDVAPTYFDVEITTAAFSDYKSLSVILGEDIIPNLDPSEELILSFFPAGEVEFLRLTMDYTFLSADESQQSREFREYHFYRIKPTTGGFIFTTLEEYK